MLCTTSNRQCCLSAVTARENAITVKRTKKPRGWEVNLEREVCRPSEASSMKNGPLTGGAHREAKGDKD